jgi:lysozyme
MGAMALIPDVSNYQGHVDWNAVLASGRVGGICKATEALSYVDPTFAANWAALKTLGATKGAYHFAQPASTVPEVQADKFLSVVALPDPADLLVLDIEVGTGDLSKWALTWLDRVLAKTGIRPWLYSYGPFIRDHLTDARLADYPLWLAAYSSKAPPAPPPWKTWQLWQHTDRATIPGIRTLCDESTGTLAAPAPPPPATPPPKEVAGVNITAAQIGPVNLDGDGHGWVPIPAPLERVMFVACRGSAPARDGAYWAVLTWDVNDSGPETIVTLYGAPGETAVVYYKTLDQETP